jgi:hypothetical protein
VVVPVGPAESYSIVVALITDAVPFVAPETPVSVSGVWPPGSVSLAMTLT